MRPIAQVINSPCNHDSLTYWGVFGYLVERWLVERMRAAGLAEATEFRVGRTYGVGAEALAATVQLDIYSAPTMEVDYTRPRNLALRYVKPATLWFSISADGGVLALMTPFDVDRPKEKGKSIRPLIVGVLESPRTVSEGWVKACLDRFTQFAVATHPSMTPSAATQRIREQADGRSNRLAGRGAKPSQAEAYAAAWTALLVALVAAAITLAQIAKDYPAGSRWAGLVLAVAIAAVGWSGIRRLYVYPH